VGQTGTEVLARSVLGDISVNTLAASDLGDKGTSGEKELGLYCTRESRKHKRGYMDRRGVRRR